MRRARATAFLAVLLAIATTACGRVPNAEQRGEPTPGAVAGTGRVKGGSFTMDVQVGAAVQVVPAAGGSVTIAPATAK